MHLDIYTGHYTDNKNGASFNSIISIDGQIDDKQFNLYGESDTYQTIYITGCLTTLNFLTTLTFPQAPTFALHSVHNNTSKLMKRIEDVFNNVRKYNAISPSQIREVIDLKMRRSNRSKFDNHDQIVDIVMSLMTLHYKYSHSFKFAAVQTFKHEQMRDALQFATLHHTKAVEKGTEQSNVIEFKQAV